MHAHYDIDGPLGVIMQIFLIGIVVGYLCIAWQFYTARKVWLVSGAAMSSTADPAKSFGQLVAIFVLCSFCGYLPRLTPIPIPFIVVLHGALFFWTWAFVFGRNTVSIALALSRA